MDRDRRIEELEVAGMVEVRVAHEYRMDLGLGVAILETDERLLRVEARDPGDQVELEEVPDRARRSRLQVVDVELLVAAGERGTEIEEHAVRSVLDEDLVPPDLPDPA
jgi:hypothetical protein